MQVFQRLKVEWDWLGWLAAGAVVALLGVGLSARVAKLPPVEALRYE